MNDSTTEPPLGGQALDKKLSNAVKELRCNLGVCDNIGAQ